MTIGTRSFWWFLLLWPAAAAFTAFAIPYSFLVSTLVFFVPLNAVMALRHPRALPRAALFGIIGAFFFALIVDLVGHASGAWIASTVFPWRIFRIVPWEDLILAFLYGTAIIQLYEIIGQHRRSYRLVGRRIGTLLFVFGTLFAIVLGMWTYRPVALLWPYAYLWIGLASVALPLALDLVRHRALTGKFVRSSVYWVYTIFLYEIAAVYRGWWVFPKPIVFAGWFSVGPIAFPLEELVFTVILSAAAVLAYYEVFDDDNR